jgi:beta-carotene 15,15'-dioxygenase
MDAHRRQALIAPKHHPALESRHPGGLERVEVGGSAVAPTVTARATARLATPVAGVGAASGFVVLVWFAIAPEAAMAAAFLPLLLGMVFVGLPHGALDHLVPERMGAAWGRRPVAMSLFLGGYAGLAFAYLALWAAAPEVAFVGFLVATVVHWGQGDVDFLERFLGRRRVGTFAHLAAVVLRGALPVAIPVLAQTEAAEGLLVAAADAFGGTVGGGIALSAPVVRWGLGVLLLASGLAYVAGLRRAWSGWGGRAFDVGEVALLAALFAWVPAYLAIGVYFLAWHALRHLARLLLLRDRDVTAIAGGDLWGPVARLARDLTPITGLALIFLAALGAWSGARIEGVGGFVALYLVWISALTMPHLAVVAWMDHAAARHGRSLDVGTVSSV